MISLTKKDLEIVLDKKLDALQQDIEKKIDASIKSAVSDFTEVVHDMMSLAATKTDVQESIDELGERMDERFKIVENRLDDTATKGDFRKLDQKIDDLAVKFDIIKKVTIDDHEKRITKLEHQILHA